MCIRSAFFWLELFSSVGHTKVVVRDMLRVNAWYHNLHVATQDKRSNVSIVGVNLFDAYFPQLPCNDFMLTQKLVSAWNFSILIDKV